MKLVWKGERLRLFLQFINYIQNMKMHKKVTIAQKCILQIIIKIYDRSKLLLSSQKGYRCVHLKAEKEKVKL